MDNFTVKEITVREMMSKNLSDELISLADMMKDLSKKIKEHKADLQYTRKATELRGAADIAIGWADYILKDN